MNDSQDYINFCKNWIKKTGYPTELRAQAIFKERGWFCAEAYYYPDDDILREIDLHASFSYAETMEYGFQVDILGECKLTDKGFCIIGANEAALGGIVLASGNMKQCDGAIEHYDVLQMYSMFDESINSEDVFVGSKVVEVNGGKTDRLYRSIVSTVKASRYRKKDCLSVIEDLSVSVIPMLVVDGNLVGASLDSNNEVVIGEIEYGMVRVPYDKNTYDLDGVVVVTLKALPVVLDKIKNFVSSFKEDCFKKTLLDMRELMK